jgi:hypothetical protein
VLTSDWPDIGAEDDQSEFSATQLLLVKDVLIGVDILPALKKGEDSYERGPPRIVLKSGLLPPPVVFFVAYTEREEEIRIISPGEQHPSRQASPDGNRFVSSFSRRRGAPAGENRTCPSAMPIMTYRSSP